MRKLTFISVLVVVIYTCFTVSAFADFYVIPVPKGCEADPNLVSENIKSGVTIYGVTGDPNVVDTSSGNAGETDIAAGCTAWVDGVEIAGMAFTYNNPPMSASEYQAECGNFCYSGFFAGQPNEGERIFGCMRGCEEMRWLLEAEGHQ